MLTLSRKERQRIIIDDHIIVEVVRIRHKRVQIGIIAPSQIEVYREELYLELQEKRRASTTRQAEGNGKQHEDDQRQQLDPPGV